MYVANSEPAKWLRGGGRAGLPERVLISGEPNRGGVGRDMGRQCDLTRGSPPVLAPIVSRRGYKTGPRGEETLIGKGAEGGRSACSTEDSGPEKPGNRAEEKTLTTWPVGGTVQ
jgi:hypothetical protein